MKRPHDDLSWLLIADPERVKRASEAMREYTSTGYRRRTEMPDKKKPKTLREKAKAKYNEITGKTPPKKKKGAPYVGSGIAERGKSSALKLKNKSRDAIERAERGEPPKRKR